MGIQNSDQEVISVANRWLLAGHRVFLVTVVRTWGSSPRPVGSIAAVRDDGELVGSVSGGCVEKQLVESLITKENAASLENRPSTDNLKHTISTLHVDDEQAQRFGLSCGGELELVFESLTESDALSALAKSTDERQCVRRTVDLSNGKVTLQSSTDRHSTSVADRFIYRDATVTKVFGPEWRLLIIGAGQLARYTAEFAMALDYEVLVCDPRPGFKEAWAVPNIPVMTVSADDAVREYATDASSAVLALTHDPNVDDLALLEALPSKAFYVGALGSKRNYEKRKHRLAGLGLTTSDIDRLVGPVGLDIGSRTSAEIAISIVAHLVQVRRQKQTD
ncbi:MAG: XdhC family protein [Gammaproteobacteria bacterium]|nr:XdhC family protein [Gammaproteobacteria bacterium]